MADVSLSSSASRSALRTAVSGDAAPSIRWVAAGRAGGPAGPGMMTVACRAGRWRRAGSYAVLPAAPDDAAPGAAEGPQRSAVVVAAVAGVGVAVGRPRFHWRLLCASVPSALRRRLLHAQRNFACLRLPIDRDGCSAAVGGDRVSVRVAPAAVADLGQQRGRADDRLASAEEAAEDLPVGVRVERLGDLASTRRSARPCSVAFRRAAARSGVGRASRSRQLVRPAPSVTAPGTPLPACGWGNAGPSRRRPCAAHPARARRRGWDTGPGTRARSGCPDRRTDRSGRARNARAPSAS